LAKKETRSVYGIFVALVTAPFMETFFMIQTLAFKATHIFGELS
jgi:hypothetical protein